MPERIPLNTPISPVLFFDFETTGLPDWKAPSDAEHQPHIVEIGAILADSGTKEPYATFSVMIQPEHERITEETEKIHGVFDELAWDAGVSEETAVNLLLQLRSTWPTVSFNKQFEHRILRIAMKRYGMTDAMEQWKTLDTHHCAMKMAKDYLGVKKINLADAYQSIVGCENPHRAHTALGDAKAAMDLYFTMNR